MNMGVANPVLSAKLRAGCGDIAAGVSLMNASSIEPPAQATTILLVEDDAPTSWRLQDALGRRDMRNGERAPLPKRPPRWRRAREKAARRGC